MKERKIKLQTNVNPYVYRCDSFTVLSCKIFVLLFIQFLALILSGSFGSVLVVTSAILGSLCASSLYYLITKEELYKSSELLIQGLLIGFFLPSGYPLSAVFVITFGILFAFKAFSRNSNNWLNPAMVCVVVFWFVGKAYFPSFMISSDLVTVKNPSAALISQGSFPIFSFDGAVTNFLNTYILSFFKVTLPEGFISLLWDSNSVIPAFRFNLLTIISTIVIFSSNMLLETVPLIFVLVYAFLVRLFAPFMFGGAFNSGDVILALLSSGTLFAATFAIQYPGTVPVSLFGKCVFAVISGVVAFFVMGCGTSPIGMAYTVLICNILNLPISLLEDVKITEKTRRNVLEAASLS